MKRNIVLTLLVVFTVSVSAQKSVRKAIRKGNGAFKEQRYSAAEADYAKALGEDASSKQASFNLANTFYKQQRWDEALKEYNHYLTLENEDTEKMSNAWSNMGNTLLKKKANEKYQTQEPMPQQGSSQQQKPQQTDNLKASMEAYKNALRLDPTDNETRENLAIVQKMIKDQEGDGGGDNKDQNQDKDKKEDKKEDQKQDKDKKEDKKDEKKQDENQMSQENIQQILQAIEQDERETQERVNQAKAEERKQKSERNKRQDKDW